MFRCHRLLCPAVLLAAGLHASALTTSAFGQSHTIGSSPPFDESPRSSPALSPAFDALGQEWLDSRLGSIDEDVFQRKLHDVDDFEVSDDFEGAGALDAPSLDPGAWTAPARRTAPEPDARPAFRPTNSLLAMGLAPGDVSLRSAASAYQARARRAVVGALLRTPLGRRLGRFFYVRDDNALAGERVQGPPPWSKMFPLISPRVNARTRTVGMSFVWRF